MQGILIDPKNKTVTTCEVDDVATLQSLYTLMHCSYIEQVYIGGDGKVLLVDEDGKLNYPNKDGYFKLNDCILAGCAIILGTSGDTFKSTHISLEEVAGMVEWCNPKEEQARPHAFMLAW